MYTQDMRDVCLCIVMDMHLTIRAADEHQCTKSEFHTGLMWRGIDLDAKHMAKTKRKGKNVCGQCGSNT